MARTELTKKQEIIVKMIEDGKDASQIAKRLKITRNGVYQQVRRLREQGVLPPKDGATANGGRKSDAQPRSAPAAPVLEVLEHEDPLAAVKARKGDVKRELGIIDRALTDAQSELAKLQKRVEADTAKLNEELRRLEASEAILSGKRPPTSGSRPSRQQRSRSSSSNGSPRRGSAKRADDGTHARAEAAKAAATQG